MSMTVDEKFDRADAFAQEFKALVRKHMPEYPRDDPDKAILLCMLQERTSVYCPFIWEDDHE